MSVNFLTPLKHKSVVSVVSTSYPRRIQVVSVVSSSRIPSRIHSGSPDGSPLADPTSRPDAHLRSHHNGLRFAPLTITIVPIITHL